MDQPDSLVTKELSELNSARHFRKAMKRAEQYLATDPNKPTSAHLYFQGSLAARLSGHPKKAAAIWALARQSIDYTEAMEADYVFDAIVLPSIRIGNAQQAQEGLNSLEQAYSADANEMAKWMMAQGRIYFLDGDFKEAAKYHYHAERIFYEESVKGTVNETWRRNNAYYRFRAERCLPKKLRSLGIVGALYARVREDPAASRRHFAKLILKTGRFGCWIEDTLLHIRTVVTFS